MKDRLGQLYVTKVTWAFRHAFTARLAFEVAVNGAHARVHQSAQLWFVRGFIHNLGMLNL